MSSLSEIPTCALDETGVRTQRDRYARVAPGVERLERDEAALTVHFHVDYDRATLDEALAVERECCPFFVLELDEPARRLRVTVSDPEQRPALDALAHAFGG